MTVSVAVSSMTPEKWASAMPMIAREDERMGTPERVLNEKGALSSHSTAVTKLALPSWMACGDMGSVVGLTTA